MAENLAALLTDENRLREVTTRTFSEDDLDGSGFLDAREMHRLMLKVAKCSNAPDPLPAEVHATMQETDMNHDGTIDYAEYLEFARKLLGAIYTRMTNKPAPGQKPKTPKPTTPTPAKPKTPTPAKPIEKELPSKPPEVHKEPPRAAEPTRETPKEMRRPQESPVKPSRAEAISSHMTQFENYMNRWKLNEAMQLIYVEIETQKVEPAQVYKYTATRLRQLSKDPRFISA